MYDSIDGKQASILKDVDLIASDSTYSHKDGVTIASDQPWTLNDIKAAHNLSPEPLSNKHLQATYDTLFNPKSTSPALVPEFCIENSAFINPDYLKLAQIAYDTVLQTMLEGEAEHGEEWKGKSIEYHKEHALRHAELNYTGDTFENHTNNGMTRDAIIKYLEGSK
jgi:hypothetical protein